MRNGQMWGPSTGVARLGLPSLGLSLVCPQLCILTLLVSQPGCLDLTLTDSFHHLDYSLHYLDYLDPCLALLSRLTQDGDPVPAAPLRLFPISIFCFLSAKSLL